MGGNRTEAGLGGHGDCMDLPERAPRTNTAMSGRHRLTHRGQLGATRRADAASPPPRGELGDGKAKNAAFRDAERVHGRAAHVQDVDRHVGAVVRERRITPGLIRQQLAPLVRTTYWQAQQYGRGVSRISAGRLHVFARARGRAPPLHRGRGTGQAGRPTAQQWRPLDLVRSFAVLPQRRQEALGGPARALVEGAGDGRDDPGRELAAATGVVRVACRAGAVLRPDWSRTRRRERPTSWVRP